MDRSEPNRSVPAERENLAQYLAMEAALIPTPIRQVLFTIRKNGVSAVYGRAGLRVYGAAQVSRTIIGVAGGSRQFSKTAESFGGFERQKNCSPAV